jgi:hypothetical protein
VSEAHKRLMVAMAMQETTHMEVTQRDIYKDGDGLAANATLFNLSLVSRAVWNLPGQWTVSHRW